MQDAPPDTERGRSLRAREVFAAASERPPDQRPEYLEAACGEDGPLREQVISLLEAHERAGAFLGGATLGVDFATGACAAAEGAGSVVGPYKLLELIGEGGFGEVYMAEQETPIRRRVALKVIKLGMGTRQVLARFDAERQALALMDHPGIAKVLDAGTTPGGRPYFVMELVKGVPIGTYCDQNQLTTRERLDLFVHVCRAVQHAHQKGVIHRDLKPGNVLVTLHDGTPVPKVIDFGIAKATSRCLTERTLFTEYRQMIGTPVYMSPEQAEMSGLDVDTRSDVYSLGVLLYELLTGTTPFDAEEVRCKAYGEIQRIIREVEPPVPSTRLGTLGDALAGVAQRRRTEPAKLGQLVRGELDWIVMKCLEKDRARRYDTASALADDVQRFLRDELVQARPPGRAYRLRKLARRHRIALACAGAVAAALVAGLSVATVALVHATRERDNALRARAAESEQRSAAEAARDQAQRATAQAVEVNDLMHEMFVSVNSRRTGDEASLRRALDEAAARIERGSLGQPEVEAAGRTTVGDLYLSWGYLPEAERQLRAAIAIRRRISPASGDPVLARTLGDLGWLLYRKREHEGAETLLRESLAMNRATLPATHPAVANNLHALAVVLVARGELDEARQVLRESLSLREREYGAALARSPGDPGLLGLRGSVRARAGDLAGARDDYSAALAGDPDNHWYWFQRTPLRLYLGDGDGYREDCREILEQFAGSANPEVSERVAKLCLLDPEFCAPRMGQLARPIDRALASKSLPSLSWFQVTKGMFEYRSARPEAAVVWLRKGRETMRARGGQALADFFLAMSFHRLGRRDFAEQALANGVRLTPDDPIEVAGLDPFDGGSAAGNWLVARIARREAEELIRGRRDDAPGPTTAPAGPAGESADASRLGEAPYIKAD